MKFCGIAAVAVIATAGVAKGAPRKNGGRNGNRNNNRMPNSNYNPFANKANINKKIQSQIIITTCHNIDHYYIQDQTH